jgi:hypothetical protein
MQQRQDSGFFPSLIQVSYRMGATYPRRVSDAYTPLSRWDVFKIALLSIGLSAALTGAIILVVNELF